MDTMQNIDVNGNINPLYYDNAIRDTIERNIDVLGYDHSKITSLNMYALMGRVYKSIFKPIRTDIMKSCNIPYTEKNIKILITIYLDIVNEFGCLPSIKCFTRMTGIDDETIAKYVTDVRSLFLNERREYLINRLNDSNLGILTLANNEQSIGLMYNRQNIIDHATVKQSLGMSDLIKVSEASNGKGSSGLIEQNSESLN